VGRVAPNALLDNDEMNASGTPRSTIRESYASTLNKLSAASAISAISAVKQADRY
jgi:hypothetical protein